MSDYLNDVAPFDPQWILDAIAIGLVVLDKDQRVVKWNRWIEQHSGVMSETILGRVFSEVCPEIQETRLLMAINSAIHNRMSSLISPALHNPVLKLYQAEKDRIHDRRMQQLIHAIPMTVNGDSGCILQFQDMTATVKRERRLRMHADQLKASSYLDALTGLYNRRKFDESLTIEFTNAKEENKSLSLLMIDIDFFKLFNEHYGQKLGDECLAKIGRTIREAVSKTSELSFRYGSEEIAVILSGASETSACLLAERTRILIESLKIQHNSSKTANCVTVSIGVATITELDQLDPQTLIHAADMALYHAKSDGRNRAMCFSLATGNIRACL